MRKTIASIILICTLITVNTALSQAPRWELVHYPDAPVIIPGFQSPWDSNGVSDPELLWDGTYFRLYYAAIGSDEVQRIALAYSSDLTNWNAAGVVLEPMPGSFDSDGVGDPDILRDESGRYHLYYTAQKGGWKQIARVESDNGVVFSEPRQLILGPSYNSDRFDSIGVAEPSVAILDGQHQMVYRGFDGTNWYRMGLAISTDGGIFNRIVNPDDFGANFGLGPHGFDDGGATEPEIWTGNANGIRLLYTSLHY